MLHEIWRTRNTTDRYKLTPACPGRKAERSMYTEKTRTLRQCMAMTRRGVQCRAFALWNNPANRCAVHTYAHRRRVGLWRYPWRAEPCSCPAFNFPHRLNSGGCRWPDLPEWTCTTPTGTHRWPRIRGVTGELIRQLQNRDPGRFGDRWHRW